MNQMEEGSPIGDLLRAWEQLRPADAETRAQIAALLGLELRVQPPAAKGQMQVPPVPPEIELPPDEGPARLTAETTRRDILVQSVPVQIELSRDEVLGQESLSMPETLPPAPAKSPLLTPRWVRGIFSAHLSAPAASRELDVECAIRDLERGAPLRRIPWRTFFTLSPGVRCYIDAGDVMDVLSADAWEVLRTLRALAGFERISVGSFETIPDGPDARLDSDSEGMATSDSPILLLTDFGRYHTVGRRSALTAEWVAWAARERARGTTVIVALTPLDRADWPPELRSEIRFVHWDTETAAPMVRRRA